MLNAYEQLKTLRASITKDILKLMTDYHVGSKELVYELDCLEMHGQEKMDGRIEKLTIKDPLSPLPTLTVDVRFEQSEENEELPLEKLCTEDLLNLYEDIDHYMATRWMDDDGANDPEEANEIDEIDPNPGPDPNNELN